MSWLVSSIANSLRLDDDEQIPAEDDGNVPSAKPGGKLSAPLSSKSADDQTYPSDSFPIDDRQTSPRRGIKEDLSELSKTLTSQLWGVASFLAPPPPTTSDKLPSYESDPDASSPDGITAGIRSDLSEIGGRFRSGISILSANTTVSEFTKIASNLLHFDSEEAESAQRGEVVGITEEVVAFARDIAMHPKTWLDFALPDDAEEKPDFDLSDAQQEHVMAVERLAPQLADMRNELCPEYMTEGCFWKIYFVLVHPRLTMPDAQLLSTSQIMKARAMLIPESESQNNLEPEDKFLGRGNHDGHEDGISAQEEQFSVPSNNPSEPVSRSVLAVETLTSIKAGNADIDKHPIESVEIPMVDKTVAEEFSACQAKNEQSGSTISNRIEEKAIDGDARLKEESAEMGTAGGCASSSSALQDNDDVSFSDLEEDADEDIPIKFNKVDEIQVNSGIKYGKEFHVETQDSNDWFDIDDIDDIDVA